MQKSKILLAALSAAALFGAAAAQAQTSGSTYYTPSGDDGCNAATYAEAWDNINHWWYWDVPSLANGESVTLPNSVSWWNSWGSGWIPAEENSNATWLTFSCNYGYINTNGYGYWW